MVVQTREHQLEQSSQRSQSSHLLTLIHLPLQWPLVSFHQRFHPLPLMPHHSLPLSFHLHQHTAILRSIPHLPGIGYFSEHSHSADHNPLLSAGADSCHSGPAHCHPEADPASSRHYISSWACHSQLIRAITGPSFCWSAYALLGASYRRGSWAIISTTSLHVTQEVPLPPYFSIAFITLRTMFSLVGGRVEEGSFVINAKLFW